MISDLTTKAIDAVFRGKESYCKFLSANDSGETGGHQSGILISKTAKEMLWTEQEMKENHILKRYGKPPKLEEQETALRIEKLKAEADALKAVKDHAEQSTGMMQLVDSLRQACKTRKQECEQ